jgi:hypothetical protein
MPSRDALLHALPQADHCFAGRALRLLDQMRLGVLLGSTAAALAGVAVVLLVGRDVRAMAPARAA